MSTTTSMSALDLAALVDQDLLLLLGELHGLLDRWAQDFQRRRRKLLRRQPRQRGRRRCWYSDWHRGRKWWGRLRGRHHRDHPDSCGRGNEPRPPHQEVHDDCVT